MRRKVLIFGTGKGCKECLDLIDCDVIAFLDNDKLKQGTQLHDIPIIPPELLHQYQYDYVIIASQFYNDMSKQLLELGVSYKAILYSFQIKVPFNPKIFEFINSNVEYEGFITGLSYAEVGINSKYFSRPIYNLGLGSQDLYYDYVSVKHLYNQCGDKMRNMKYALICLAYYSFDYDVSKTKSFEELIYRYFGFGDLHNYADETVIENVKMGRAFLDLEIIDKARFNRDSLLQHQKTNILKYENANDALTSATQSPEILFEKLKAFKKDYYRTRVENTKILRDYVNLLRMHNVKPFFIICPVSRCMREVVSSECKQKLDVLLHEYSDIKILDYFYNPLFEDGDFYDFDHLNKKGAIKFTKLLEKELSWSIDS